VARQARNSRDAEHLLALFGGLICVGIVSAFLREWALPLLVTALAGFGWLLFRRRGTHTDLTVRLGVGAFILGLGFVLIRPHLNLG
jgi:hypothetical protein